MRSLARLVTVTTIFIIVLAGSVRTVNAGIITYPGQPPGTPLNTTAKYLVLIVLDGATPDYFHLVSLPNISALAARGTTYTQAFSGILESETPAGHATISTGSSPTRSGILGFSWAENDKDYSLFSPAVVRSGAMEQIMQDAHAPTIAGLYKARFPQARVVALSGSKYYAADPLGGPNADAIIYFRSTLQHTFAPTAIPGHVPPAAVFNDPALTVPLNKLPFGREDSMATDMALDTFAVMHQQMTLINYPEFDWPLGHVYGGIIAKPQVESLMREFDYDLGRFEATLKAAGVLKRTLFVITADHGMTPITRYVPDSIFNNAVKEAGTTAPSMAHNTATYIWLRDQTKGAAVAANIIKVHDPGIQSVYYLSSVKNRVAYVRAPGLPLPAAVDAANQHLLRTLINSHEPNVVVLCRKGQTTSPPSAHWKADHGGATWGVQHIPLIIAGPGIRSNFQTPLPAQLEDIAPTVLTAMGVRPTGMEGHVLTEALDQPYAADVQRRASELARITPVVNALVKEDAAESR